MQNHWGMKGSSKYWLAATVSLILACALFGQASADTVQYIYYDDGQIYKAVYATKVVEFSYDLAGNLAAQTVTNLAPAIGATPPSLAFGSVDAGTTSTPLTTTITNTGSAQLNIQNITITGTHASMFAKQSDACSNTSLQIGGTCTVSAVFQSAGPDGGRNASLSIPSNAANAPTFDIPLSGSAHCSYSLNPTTNTIPYSAYNGTVIVTGGTGCPWTAVSTGLLTITSGASGTANGTVGYSVPENTTFDPRSGGATIAGIGFSLTQAGMPPCTYSITPSQQSFGVAGGNGSVSVTTIGSCAWSITNTAGWISIQTGGSGSVAVNYSVSPNTGTASRSAIVTIAGQQFTVTQGGTADVDKIGVYSGGYWYLDLNGNGLWDGEPTDKLAHFGWAGALPVVGDWTGTGTTKIGVFNPSDVHWYLDLNGNGLWDGEPTDKLGFFGFAGTVPVVGDWTGSGTVKIGVFNSSDAHWYLDLNNNGLWDGEPTDKLGFFGFAGTVPVVGDWTGSGTVKIGVFNSSDAHWYLDLNNNGLWDGEPTDKLGFFGFAGALPVIGKW